MWIGAAYKKGNIVNLTLNVQGTMPANIDFIDFFTLPDEYHPKETLFINYPAQSGTTMAMRVTKDGKVGFHDTNTPVNNELLCRQSITYLTN